MTLYNILLVAIGSAFGGVLRYAAVEGMARLMPSKLSIGTILVNITGSFVIGFLAGLTRDGGQAVLNPEKKALILVGVLGGYTTFSSFSLQTLNLAKDGHPGLAVVNVLSSVVFCLAAVYIGHWAARAISD